MAMGSREPSWSRQPDNPVGDPAGFFHARNRPERGVSVMSETTTSTAGTSTTTATEQGTMTGQAGTQPTTEQQPAFTPPASQADLDRIIENRLSRERAKYAGFDACKSKATEYDKLTEASKSDLEKAHRTRGEGRSRSGEGSAGRIAGRGSCGEGLAG